MPSPEEFACLGFILSRASSLLQRPSRMPPNLPRHGSPWCGFMGSSHEVPCPFSVRTRRVGHRSVSTRNTIPPRPFSDPRGFDPHRASWPCFVPQTLMGFFSSRLFPTADLLRARHPKIPSRRFPGLSEENPAAPPGPCILRQSVASSGIVAPAIGPMPSRDFTSPLRHLAIRLGVHLPEGAPLEVATHPLLTF